MIIARKKVRIPVLISCRLILLGGPARFASHLGATYGSKWADILGCEVGADRV